jgi:hypothetical protein
MVCARWGGEAKVGSNTLSEETDNRALIAATKSERATSLASRRPLFRFFEGLVRLPDHNPDDLGILKDLRACARVSLILPRSHPLREFLGQSLRFTGFPAPL